MGQWCHNSLGFKIEFQPLLTRTLQMLYAAHTLGACPPLCKVSQKSKRGASRYTERSKKWL